MRPTVEVAPVVLTMDTLFDLVKSFVLLVTPFFFSVAWTVTAPLARPLKVTEFPFAPNVKFPLFS